MGWSSSGTFTNDATKDITAVASVTGGIQVTCSSHGYSNGDFIQITETTDYNGAWIISNVQTNTFDIVDQLKMDGTALAYTSSQTGKCAKGAKDLSGITSVSNVSRILNDNNDFIYHGDTSVEISIEGAVLMNPEFETLILNRTPGDGNNALTITNNGIFQIGKRDKENDYFDFPVGTALIFPNHSTDTKYRYSETWAPLRVESNGELKWIGGSIFTSGPIALYGKVLIASQSCILSSRNVGLPQIRQRTTSLTVLGLTTHDVKLTAIANASKFNGYKPIHSPSVIDTSSSSSANVWYTFYDLIAGLGNDKEVGLKNKTWVRLVDCNLGTDISVQAQRSDQSGQEGICEVREQVYFTIQQQDGTKIEGCRIFCRDYNHSHRLAANTYNDNPDYTSDKTYSGVTDSNGALSFTGDTGSILIGVFHRPSTGSDATVFDSRCKNDDHTDILPFGFACYGYIAGMQEVILKGIGGKQVTYVLFVDNGITESNKSTVSGYTSIDDFNKLYDRAQYWVQESDANLEEIGLGNMVVVSAGKIIDFGSKNVYLDSGYSDVFKYEKTNSNVQIKIGSSFASTSKYDTLKATTFYLNDAINLSNMTFDGDLHINTGDNSTLNFSNVTVTGKVYNDDSSHTLTINATNGSSLTADDAGTGNGETNIRNLVTVTITVKDAVSGDTINDARVFLKTDPGGDVIFNEVTGTDGKVEKTDYNYTGDTNVVGWARRASSSPYYKTGTVSGTITSNGFSATILLVKDE